ncbi:MAG: PmoA family protein [Opitutaceae bacterium]|nr:PmoA family protein [Opitutaceae bacterium]
MNAGLQLRHEPGRHVEIETADGATLLRYVYAPATPANESPRPYAHPVRSLAGDVLTNFRPNDHPWHHALSVTLTSVDGVNFWGGPSHRAADGYQWRDDQGAQVHREWLTLSAGKLEQRLDWIGPRAGRVLLHEQRTLAAALVPGGWSLRWTSELRNATGRDLELGNYHALGGLAGSHYTGLQFRGARDLLDEHGDTAIGIRAEGGLAGEAAVHGAAARWMEWLCQHDGTLRRTRIRFEHPAGPLPWFVRAKNPLAAFAFHRDKTHLLPAGATLRLDHLLSFTAP